MYCSIQKKYIKYRRYVSYGTHVWVENTKKKWNGTPAFLSIFSGVFWGLQMNKSGRSKYKVPPKYNVVESNITLGYKQQIQKQNHSNDYGHAKLFVQ